MFLFQKSGQNKSIAAMIYSCCWSDCAPDGAAAGGNSKFGEANDVIDEADDVMAVVDDVMADEVGGNVVIAEAYY